MLIAERDSLIEIYNNQIESLRGEYIKHQDPATRALMEKVYDMLDSLKKTPLTPEVGLGATSGYGADCYPHTVVWVSEDGKKLEVTDDTHHTQPGFDYYSKQEYTYTSNMNGPRTRYRLRKNGRWVKDGEPMNGGSSITLGHRRYYQDPSF